MEKSKDTPIKKTAYIEKYYSSSGFVSLAHHNILLEYLLPQNQSTSIVITYGSYLAEIPQAA